MSSRTAAVIVAAGRGLRAGGGVPKQWRMLGGKTVLAYTLAAFRGHPKVGPIVLVLHRDDMGLAEGYESHADVTCVAGGDTRSASVMAGLNGLPPFARDVLIHDAARPLVPSDVIDRVIDALNEHTAAAPGLAVTDALWTGAQDIVTGLQDRTGLYAAQTPQGFRVEAIRTAHSVFHGAASDDVEVARAAGISVQIVPGDARNLKITTPEDFARAEAMLRGAMDVRVGNGFDVHRFGEGDLVMLCGVAVPHDKGLVGHSDADVAMHAVTDALYGALSAGDIGRHFPPSDPQWKGAASEVFLAHAAKLATDQGYRIAQIDCTIICEYPKIGPHAVAMQGELARITGAEADRISVKATTSEQLGFTGRGEGIAAQATATLIGG